MTALRFSKVRDVKSPTRGTEKSAGLDFYVPNDFLPAVIYPGDDVLIPSGIKADIPEGYAFVGVDKSGIATSSDAKRKANIASTDLHKPCLIVGAKLVDEDYQGEMHIHIINVGKTSFRVEPGMKIAQFVLVPVLYAEPIEVLENELFTSSTGRGEGGFSSTGIK